MHLCATVVCGGRSSGCGSPERHVIPRSIPHAVGSIYTFRPPTCRAHSLSLHYSCRYAALSSWVVGLLMHAHAAHIAGCSDCKWQASRQSMLLTRRPAVRRVVRSVAIVVTKCACCSCDVQQIRRGGASICCSRRRPPAPTVRGQLDRIGKRRNSVVVGTTAATSRYSGVCASLSSATIGRRVARSK